MANTILEIRCLINSANISLEMFLNPKQRAVSKC